MRLPLPRWTAAALLVTLAGAARPVEPTPFSMILERTENGWHATCETGCTWTELSAKNDLLPSERVKIDNTSISNSVGDVETTTAFAFTLETDGAHGWKAKGLRGTSWITIGYTCGAGSCRARLTETGVEGLN